MFIDQLSSVSKLVFQCLKIYIYCKIYHFSYPFEVFFIYYLYIQEVNVCQMCRENILSSIMQVLKFCSECFSLKITVYLKQLSVCSIVSSCTGVGCCFLLQKIFPTQGIKPASPTLAGGFFTIVPSGNPKNFRFSLYMTLLCKSWSVRFILS